MNWRSDITHNRPPSEVGIRTVARDWLSNPSAPAKPVVHEVILKLNRKCNLRCSYCYYVNESTINRNERLDARSTINLITKYGEYCKSQQISGSLIFHGGEPLLQGRQYFEKVIFHANQHFPEMDISIQTNGTLIDEAWISLLNEFDISVGISFDGSIEQNDRNRIQGSKQDASDTILKNIIQLQKHQLLGGILSVIDPTFSGKASVRFFYDLGVRWVDFLIPYRTHDTTTVGPGITENGASLGRFLTDAFMEWVRIDDPFFKIRIFDEVLRRSLQSHRNELTAIQPSYPICVEPDGRFCRNTEFSDSSSLFDKDFYNTGLNIYDHSFEQVVDDMIEFADANDLRQPHRNCSGCDMWNLCRGGAVPSRYKIGQGFQNPSANCADLYLLSKLATSYIERLRIRGGDDADTC